MSSVRKSLKSSVTQRRAEDFLHGKGDTLKRKDSDLKPNAQYTKLCETWDGRKTLSVVEAISIVEKSNLMKVEKAIIRLMVLFGLRVSEVLDIKVSDVSKDGRIRIHGKKNSNSRIVFDPEYIGFWTNDFELDYHCLCCTNRFRMYREMKKMFGGQRYEGLVNCLVTHRFRHEAILDVKASGVSLNEQKEFIGHKSQNSTKRYGVKRK